MPIDEPAFRAAATEALQEWDIDVAALKLVSQSENVAYRVDGDDGQPYTLRLHRPTYHTLPELKSEQTWTLALNQAGISAPEVVPARNGEGYARVAIPRTDEMRYVGMLRWVDGELLGQQLRDAQPQEVERGYERLGGIMARIHEQALHWSVPSTFVRPSLDEDGLMGDTPFWGPFWDHPDLSADDQARFTVAKEALRENLKHRSKDGVFSLIHADLHAWNIVLNQEQVHVIDFDDSAFGWHAYDFAVAAPGPWTDPRAKLCGEALVRGYRRERQLDEEVLESIPFFTLIRRLQHLGWIRQRPELGRPDLAPVARDIHQRLDGFGIAC